MSEEGNHEAGTCKKEQFMFLYRQAHDRLSRFVHSMVWNTEDAKDIISETVLKTYENFEKIQRQDAFVYYMFGIAGNLARHRFRRLKHWTPLEEHHTENMSDQSSNIDNKMDVGDLYRAMSQLTERQREAVSLFEISGFSLNEIQVIQGGSLSGVKSRIGRAREELALLLEKDLQNKSRKYFNSSLEKVVTG